MTNVKELTEIIEFYGGIATFESIISRYQLLHHMLAFSEHKSAIAKILNDTPDTFSYNEDDKTWRTESKSCKKATNNNLFSDIDIKTRAYQKKPLSKEETSIIYDRLKQMYEVQTSPKNYECFHLLYNGKKVGSYWCKQEYIRLVIYKLLLPRLHFSIDLSNRTRMDNIKGTEEYKYTNNEFVLTQPEADVVLSEIFEQLKSM